MTHPCPGGCGTAVDNELLACKTCWARLPVAYQRAVSSAYRRRAQHPEAHTAAVAAARRWYQQNPPRNTG